MRKHRLSLVGLLIILAVLILGHFIPVRSQSHDVDCKVPPNEAMTTYRYRLIFGQYSSYKTFSRYYHVFDCNLLLQPSYINLKEKDNLYLW